MAKNGISNLVINTLNLFQQLVSTEPSDGAFTKEPPLAAFYEQNTRFRIWSGNIGAHSIGRRSLEYRLRDASHIQKQVLRLLEDLNTLLEDAIAILTGKTTPWDQLEDEEFELTDNGLDNMINDPPEDMSRTELEQIATDVDDVVNCLLRLSMAIRHPAPHDRFAGFLGTDTSHYEPFDTQHVQSKFSEAEDYLIKRLGKAISNRRQYFKYRESHHLKLNRGMESGSQMDTGSTIASSIPNHLKTGTFNPELAIVDEDAYSDAGVSQTSFASTAADAQELRVPPLPANAEKGPFECPFCFMIITATNTFSWKRHVFGDLRPYICLFRECSNSERHFARRHDWTEHEIQNHWKIYHCPLACDVTFESATDCRSHIDRAHAEAALNEHIDAIISVSAISVKREGQLACPLCKMDLGSLKEYRRHVGRHQEQIALFALPSLYSNDNEKESAEDHDAVNDEISSWSASTGESSDVAEIVKVDASHERMNQPRTPGGYSKIINETNDVPTTGLSTADLEPDEAYTFEEYVGDIEK